MTVEKKGSRWPVDKPRATVVIRVDDEVYKIIDGRRQHLIATSARPDLVTMNDALKDLLEEER